jgi:hypothetical protein
MQLLSLPYIDKAEFKYIEDYYKRMEPNVKFNIDCLASSEQLLRELW